MNDPKYKTRKENYEDALKELESYTDQELRDVLKTPTMYHAWFVAAAEVSLAKRTVQS